MTNRSRPIIAAFAVLALIGVVIWLLLSPDRAPTPTAPTSTTASTTYLADDLVEIRTRSGAVYHYVDCEDPAAPDDDTREIEIYVNRETAASHRDGGPCPTTGQIRKGPAHGATAFTLTRTLAIAPPALDVLTTHRVTATTTAPAATAATTAALSSAARPTTTATKPTTTTKRQATTTTRTSATTR